MTSPDPTVARSQGFEAFFRREYPAMVALAIAVSGNRAIGEDLAQDALVRAHRHWDRISRYDKPGAWLRRVTINLATSARTRLAKDVRARIRWGSQEATFSPAPEVDGPVWDAVKQLPPKQRAAVALYYLEDRSVAEIAEILECAEGTAKAHLHKGRTALAAELAGGER